MNLRTVVIIATKGRPNELSNLLQILAQQTVLPDKIIVSACEPADILQNSVNAKNVEVLLGPPGLAAQRNRALASVRKQFDIVIFFDDDFIPSRFWIQRIQMLLRTHTDIVCATGRLLIDGVTVGGIDWSKGQSMVDKTDFAKKLIKLNDFQIWDHESPYGCNMAFRGRSIDDLTFDERLVLYGWMEDRDFGFRAARDGRMIWTDAIWGVHLGTKSGRVSGLRFGYSQVVNPWYLMKKGSISPFNVCRKIFRGLAGNLAGSLLPFSHVDRWGRLKGNIIGLKDILFGRWAPEKAAEL